MSAQATLGLCCQSCSMPLVKPEDFGTSCSGAPVDDFCRYCYQDGAFTNARITMEHMIDLCAVIMAQRGIMPEPRARQHLREVLPGLKRWREGAAEQVPECACCAVRPA